MLNRFVWAGACVWAMILPVVAPAQSILPSASDWTSHLTQDLLPFWSAPGAEGTPPGAFPQRLCNDGSVPVLGVPCSGVPSSYDPAQRTLVSHARQTFSYAIAFHMTGDPQWLSLAQAGVAEQFSTFYDATSNRFAEAFTPGAGPDPSLLAPDAQKQAYGLLGPTMVYYLTGDPTLYARISTVAEGIETDFRRGDGFAQSLGAAAPSARLVDTLDQLNSYQTLLATTAPLADRAALEARALRSARDLKARFHDPVTGLFKTDAAMPDGALAGQSFGHSIKALWFIDQTAQLAGDMALARFASDGAAAVFARAFDPVSGGWYAGTDTSGALSPEGVWWDHAELSQYAAALAITRPELRGMLAEAQRFWLDHYVDGVDAGIWSHIDLLTGLPTANARKQDEWKAGFHSYEHALISYLSASAMENAAAELFFAREGGLLPDRLAYGFAGDVTLVPGTPALFGSAAASTGPSMGPEIQHVLVSNLTYADASLTPVPAPPAVLLLGAGLLALTGWRRRTVRRSA